MVSEPVPLQELVAEGLKLAAIGLTLLTRKTFGYDLSMRGNEAYRLAKPITRVISRRFQIKRDLSDATDVVGTGTGVMTWIDRVLSSRRADANITPTRSPGPPEAFDRPAAAPPPTAHLLSDESQGEQLPDVADRDGKPVPGTGPSRAAFLGGFEDL